MITLVAYIKHMHILFHIYRHEDAYWCDIFLIKHCNTSIHIWNIITNVLRTSSSSDISQFNFQFPNTSFLFYLSYWIANKNLFVNAIQTFAWASRFDGDLYERTAQKLEWRQFGSFFI